MKTLNEKKQIIILVIVLLLIGGFSLYMLRDNFKKNPSTSDAKNSVNLKLDTDDGDEKIDWSCISLHRGRDAVCAFFE